MIYRIRGIVSVLIVIAGLVALLHGWRVEDMHEEVAGAAFLVYGELRGIAWDMQQIALVYGSRL